MQTADGVDLTQAHLLALADSTHLQTADEPNLEAESLLLIVSDAIHDQLAALVTLYFDETGHERVFLVAARGRLFAVASATPRRYAAHEAPDWVSAPGYVSDRLFLVSGRSRAFAVDQRPRAYAVNR